MQKKSVLIRLRPVAEGRANFPSIDFYNTMLESCFLPKHLTQLNPSFNEYTFDEYDFIKRLNTLSKRKQGMPPCLLIDFSAINKSYRGYHRACDYLASHLSLVVESLQDLDNKFIDIIIYVADHESFSETVLFKERLVEACTNKKVGLVVLSLGPSGDIFIAFNSGRFSTRGLKKFILANRDQQITIPPSEYLHEMSNLVDIVFGHFEVTFQKIDDDTMGEKKFHVPALVSLNRSSTDLNKYLSALKERIRQKLGSEDFHVYSFGFQGEIIKDFARALVEYEEDRILPSHLYATDKNIAVICDILWDVYPLPEFVQNCHNNGAKNVFVWSLARYASYCDTKINSEGMLESILELDYQIYKPGRGHCPFCDQLSPIKKIDSVQQAESNIYSYDPYTFWELVSDTPKGYFDGHSYDEDTRYHYLQRIDSMSILQRHGYDIACRLRNFILYEHKIRGKWIDAIICPDDDAAVMLSKFILDLLSMCIEQLIVIPREHLKGVTGVKIPDNLEIYLSKQYGGRDVLKRWNVIIVDDTLNHFSTGLRLYNLCKCIGAKVFAFAVFLNASKLDFAIDDHLPDIPFIYLYTWPLPPFEDDKCPCRMTVKVVGF